MIRELVDEAVAAGARRWRACEVLGLTVRTLERWGSDDEDGRRGPNTVPANKLSDAERRKVVAIATSAEFRDSSPCQIVPRLADRGEYVASESTFFRVLRDEDMQHHRGRSRLPVSRPREHVANGPWQVASWDITYLRSLVRGLFFYLYVVEDVWSRKISAGRYTTSSAASSPPPWSNAFVTRIPASTCAGGYFTQTTAGR